VEQREPQRGPKEDTGMSGRRQPAPTDPARRRLMLGSLAAAAAWPLARRAAAQPAGAPPSAGAARTAVEAHRDAILRLSREVWANAELSLHEEMSAQIHLRELRQAGFTIVSTGTSNIPTAFVAEWSQGQGGARVGFLPEYDALPGLGNATEPRQMPGPTGAGVCV
jgi:aminobenzoyl-glutamate utilization protein B